MRTEHHTMQAGRPYGANQTIYTASAIAAKYSDRLPTVEELRNSFGMSRATAYRWLAALKWARGAA